MRWSITLASLVLVISGCGGDVDTSSVCTPGESQSCDCVVEDVSTPGERICRAGGEEWTECLCTGSSPDASGSVGDTTASTDASGPGIEPTDDAASLEDVTPDRPEPSDVVESDSDEVDAADAVDSDADDAEEPDVTVCMPDCADKACGDDGCGGICGTCEVGWSCEAGECQAPPPCTSDEDCAVFSAASQCWTFSCDPTSKACTPETLLEGEACDDDDPCTFGDVCAVDEDEQGGCLGIPVPVDDDNDCTEDACVDGLIVHTELADGAACDVDPGDCTTGDSCAAGECVLGTPMEVDDQNPCTDDACIEGEVVHTALVEGACDDGDACTTGDSCVDGTCTGGETVECALGPCVTEAVCVSGQGCVETLAPADTPCDADDDVCTFESCDAEGACSVTGEFNTCAAESAENPCWTWVCSPTSGCETASFSAGAPCDDNDPCTQGDICSVNDDAQGGCTGQPLTVDDGNACTDDACVDGEVVNTPATGGLCIVQGCGALGICLGGGCLAPDDSDCGACVPDCAGKECGSDGCGDVCGTCAAGLPCNPSGLCPN